MSAYLFIAFRQLSRFRELQMLGIPVIDLFEIICLNIDSILYKEKAIQKQLQDTLEKVKLSNEIISSIARTYQYISRIDIQAIIYSGCHFRSAHS